MYKPSELSSLLCLMIVGVFTLFALNACAKEHVEPRPPMILPISLKNTGFIVNTKISIVDHNIYYFSLRFSYKKNDQTDRSRVKVLISGNEMNIAGNSINHGIPTPVHLIIASMENNQEIEIFSKQVDPILTSWGGDNFSKQIGFTELKPGLYAIRLKLLQAAPDFGEIPVSFGVGYDKFKMNFVPKK